MNLVIILTLIAYSSGAQLNRGYLPPDHAQTSGGSEFLKTPIVVTDEVSHKSVAELNHLNHQQAIDEYVHFGQQGHVLTLNDEGRNEVQHLHAYAHSQERSQAALERHAAVLRQESENNVDSYSYAYETQNGIYGEESGVATDGVKAHGSFSYTGDDGQKYSITYTADENGFRPHGDHLPTPPPIPAEILKSLEDNARDEAAGIYDDGSYRDEHYGYETEHTDNHLTRGEILNQEKLSVVNEADTVITNSAVAPEPTQPEPAQPEPALPEPALQEPVIPTNEPVENHELHTVANILEPIQHSQANRLYLPPRSFQFISEGLNSGSFGRFYNVKNTYLPPFYHQTIDNNESQTDNIDQDTNDNGVKTSYSPPVYSQVIANNVARKTYLPPVNRDQTYQEGPSRQNTHDVAKKTYLPPSNKQITRNVGDALAYLPPRQVSEESRHRQSSFGSKNGYQY